MRRNGFHIVRLWVMILTVTVLGAVSASAQVNAAFTAETTALTVGETGSWTITLTNPDVADITGGTLVVTIPDDFTVTSTGGGTEVTGPPHTLTWTAITLTGGGGTASFSFEAHPD